MKTLVTGSSGHLGEPWSDKGVFAEGCICEVLGSASP